MKLLKQENEQLELASTFRGNGVSTKIEKGTDQSSTSILRNPEHSNIDLNTENINSIVGRYLLSPTLDSSGRGHIKAKTKIRIPIPNRTLSPQSVTAPNQQQAFSHTSINFGARHISKPDKIDAQIAKTLSNFKHKSDEIPRRPYQIHAENDFMEQLKRDLPFAFTNANVSRHEVMNLGNWLLRIIESINKDVELSINEKNLKADEVYNLVLNELIRQITGECFERGELLMQIWKAYMNVCQEIILDYKQREVRIQDKANEEYNRLADLHKRLAQSKESHYENIQLNHDLMERQHFKMQIEVTEAN